MSGGIRVGILALVVFAGCGGDDEPIARIDWERAVVAAGEALEASSAVPAAVIVDAARGRLSIPMCRRWSRLRR